MPTRAVFLVGFMGAGKTAVGRVLGRRLGWPFEDLDDRIEAREGRSIAEIFRNFGEAEFRRAERAALRELFQELESSGPRVVALGGGAFAQAENAALLKSAGVATIFLDAPAEELWRRCHQQEAAHEANAARERPLRQDEARFRQLYSERLPHYLAATVRVDTLGKDIEAVGVEIAATLKLQDAVGKKKPR